MQNRPLRLEITINVSEPKLLEGLDLWLKMGLIGESQIKSIAQHYLSCHLPELVEETALVIETPRRDFAPEALPIPVTSVRQRPNIFSQAWQSFKDEISVRWLLFLGLFLVVLSSGVLAATQWQRFPDALQYGVLWTYTLVFWGIGFWASRQDNLLLTAQTLQTIALLLIPVNFWAMDALGKNPLEWLTVAIATVTLTGIYCLYRQFAQSIFLFFNFLVLAYLQWGWEFKFYPAIAVYIGIIITAIVLRFLPLGSNTSPFKIGRGFVVYGVSVLLVRAIFILNLPIQQFALAIGICGWLFQKSDASSTPPTRLSRMVEPIGIVLLFFAWCVSVGERFPWQAMAISLLALHFFTYRLRRDWLRRDLFAIFIVGLQAHFLVGSLIPKGFKQDAIAYSVELAKSEAFPWTVYGITLFPYLIFWVWLAGWLYRREKVQLALFEEWLTLALGIVMTIVSLLNPTWRSLNLFLSTGILIYVVCHRTPLRVALLYFAHFVGLLAICNAIAWRFPFLSSSVWAAILTGLAAIEWGVSTLDYRRKKLSRAETSRRRDVELNRRLRRLWYGSCWHFGFLLAAISYALLWERVKVFFASGEGQPIVLVWLLVPLTLMGVALRVGGRRRRRTAVLSSAALLFEQVLSIWQPETRAIALGVASGAMLVNSRYFRHPAAAAMQIGFSLALVAALFWTHLSLSGWFLFTAIAIWVLWLLRERLRQQSQRMAIIYAQASDGWALFLCAIALVVLTGKTLFSYYLIPIAHWHYLASAFAIAGAIYYRDRRSFKEKTIYGILWAGEIALTEGILLINDSTFLVAIANLLLAFLTFFGTHLLFKQYASLTRLNSLKVLPLLLAIFAVCWRWQLFTAYTGCLTFGASLIGLGVGDRFRNRKAIAFLSLAGISLACYELVIYQMLQKSGGNPADGLTVLAIVAAVIALTYRLFASFLQWRQIASFLNLTLAEIKIAAHSHWALGSILKISAAGMAIENTPRLRLISIAISVILALYAIIQGRDRQTGRDRTFSDWWVYVGLVEITATVVYARRIWEQLSILDPFQVIITCFVALAIYQIPWRNLGWQTTPWERFAIVIPAIITLTNTDAVSYLSLLVVAAFYLRIAIRQKEIRWTYISLGFIDWAIARFLLENNYTEILWYASIVGISLLYIAQFDTTLKQPQQRKNRHLLRLTGSGIICAIALLFYQETGLTPTIISLVAIFLGLALQIRAFLFVGTIAFLLAGFYQLVILSFEYSLAKWIIGLIAGITFIFIAANFEKRREEILRVLQNWLQKLEQWE
jgi:hypothetical protein